MDLRSLPLPLINLILWQLPHSGIIIFIRMFYSNMRSKAFRNSKVGKSVFHVVKADTQVEDLVTVMGDNHSALRQGIAIYDWVYPRTHRSRECSETASHTWAKWDSGDELLTMLGVSDVRPLCWR